MPASPSSPSQLAASPTVRATATCEATARKSTISQNSLGSLPTASKAADGRTQASPKGHRRYEPRDLERLQRVLFYRELGFGLDEIAALLADPRRDPLDHLREQHRLLTARGERLRRMAEAVAATIRALETGVRMTPE